MLTSLISTIFGIILILSGLIILPLPIPFGLIMIVIGMSLLISHSAFFRSQFKKLRRRFVNFSERLNKLKPHLPSFARKMIEDTDPNSL